MNSSCVEIALGAYNLNVVQIRSLSPSDPIDSTFVQQELLSLMRPAFGLYYPSFDAWFQQKLVPGFFAAKRAILIANERGFVGVSVVRLPERGRVSKISSLYVQPKYRGCGVGSNLMRSTLELLDRSERSYSIITVPEESLEGRDGQRFSLILSKFGFEKVAEVQNKYRVGKTETVFRRAS
jgi:ribosomal protein S18 acetylase RimI-like enzyme